MTMQPSTEPTDNATQEPKSRHVSSPEEQVEHSLFFELDWSDPVRARRMKRWTLFGYATTISFTLCAWTYAVHAIWTQRKTAQAITATKGLHAWPPGAMLAHAYPEYPVHESKDLWAGLTNAVSVSFLLQELQQGPHRDPRMALASAMVKMLQRQIDEQACRVIEAIQEGVLFGELRVQTAALIIRLKENLTSERKGLIGKLDKMAKGAYLTLSGSEQNLLVRLAEALSKDEFRWSERRVLKRFHAQADTLVPPLGLTQRQPAEAANVPPNVLRKDVEWQWAVEQRLASRVEAELKRLQPVLDRYEADETQLTEAEKLALLFTMRVPPPAKPAREEIPSGEEAEVDPAEPTVEDFIWQIGARVTKKEYEGMRDWLAQWREAAPIRHRQRLEVLRKLEAKTSLTMPERDALQRMVRNLRAWRGLASEVEGLFEQEELTLQRPEQQRAVLLAFVLERDYQAGRASTARKMADMMAQLQKAGRWTSNVLREKPSLDLHDPDIIVGDVSILLRDENPTVRAEAGRALVAVGWPAVPWLCRTMNRVRINPVMAVETRDMTKAEHERLLERRNTFARRAAVPVVAKLALKLFPERARCPKAVQAYRKLRKSLRDAAEKDPDALVQAAAVEGIRRLRALESETK